MREYQRTPRLKQARYLKFKWLEPTQPISSEIKNQLFIQTAQMNGLYCEY